jgi:DNA polymerase bacteriophage-type
MTLHLDFETRSAVDLKKTGVYVYAESETTDTWCAAYAMDDEPVKLWHPDLDDADLKHHLRHSETITAHNAAFERVISKLLMKRRYGWPDIATNRWRCTMAMAYAMALPGSLGQLADALQTDAKKDDSGARLMLQMAKPRSTKGGLTWWDLPEKKEKLYAYCKQDVETERAVGKRLLPLSEPELKLWHLDQKINDTGVFVDIPLCDAAIAVVEQARGKLDYRMAKLTEHDVTGCTNRNQFAAWLRKQGMDVDSVAKDALEEMLARADLTPAVREAIEIRREGAKAATSKIDALMRGVSRDGRTKGLLQFHGTVTGRWSGRRFQPQNLLRGKIKKIEPLVEAIMTRDSEMVELLYDNPLTAVGSAIRSMIKTSPGRRLVTADFSNIEGRVAAWYAGEAWKLEAFRAFDAGHGPDLYKVAYSRSFGARIADVQDEQRQIGKVMELSLQYQGGHGAFVAMAGTYGVNADDITPIVQGAVDPIVFEKALKKYRKQNGYGMTPETWAALRVLIDGWRAAHPRIKQTWADLEEAAMNAVTMPGTTFSVGPAKFKKKGSFLFLQLPSKRALCFPYPKIKQKLMPWTETVRHKDGTETEEAVWKDSLCYMGVDSFTKQWSEQFAYGGQLFDYVVQGTARDIMAEAMVRLEAAGYPIVLTVHDEVVSEPKLGHGSLEQFKAIMSQPPAWAADCPISCSGFESERYRKG